MKPDMECLTSGLRSEARPSLASKSPLRSQKTGHVSRVRRGGRAHVGDGDGGCAWCEGFKHVVVATWERIFRSRTLDDHSSSEIASKYQ